MRIQHRYFKSDSNNKQIESIRGLLDEYVVEYKYKEDTKSVIPSFKYYLEFFLYEDNPNFKDAKNAIKKFNLHFYEGTVFEVNDIKNAEWFWVTTGEFQYPLPDDDFGYLKATFNIENYCNTCGIGKIQNAPFRLKEVKQKNKQFWGIHWEHDAIFVKPETKKLLETENINGISFIKPKLHKIDIEMDNIYQLIIETTLKTGLNIFNCKAITCKYMNEEQKGSKFPKAWENRTKNSNYCGRIKYAFPTRGGLTFDSSIFKSVPDFVKSNEWFGSGASAMQLPIVSKRIKLLVEKNKLRGLGFTPIFHKECNFG